ncbi:UDP-4-amino-4-deoxy-L-arabinose--oxoglutarate aminotransferase [subsurface metagenome]
MNPIKLLEKEIIKYTGSKEAILVSSGTSAIKTGLMACGVEPGDWMVTTPFTFPSTATSALLIGAGVIFVDIDENMGIDPIQVEKAFNLYENVKGVIAPHLFGNLCDIEALREICDRYDKILVEDACQAFGLRDESGKHSGTWGEFGAFSTYATKNFWTFQGGFCITDNSELADRARAIRNHGYVNGEMVMLGDNFSMGWNSAFLGWQELLLHKIGIEAELGTQGPEKHLDIYSKLIYHHPYYRNSPNLWKKLDCPVAETVTTMLKTLIT